MKILHYMDHVHGGHVITPINVLLLANANYSLFTFSWPRFESGSLRNGGMLILHIYVLCG